MKLLRVFAMVLICAASVSLMSCEKCMTCTYEVGGQSITSPEVCGNKGDLDDSEDALTATLPGVTVNCTRD